MDAKAIVGLFIIVLMLCMLALVCGNVSNIQRCENTPSCNGSAGAANDSMFGSGGGGAGWFRW